MINYEKMYYYNYEGSLRFHYLVKKRVLNAFQFFLPVFIGICLCQ